MSKKFDEKEIRARRMGHYTDSYQRSKAQEKALAGRLGGSVVPGSGSGRKKGDVQVDRVVRVEAKTTKNASYSLKLEDLKKIEKTGLADGEVPCMVIEFNETGGNKEGGEYLVLPGYCLDYLVG